ncbi:RCC1 domain-containing protein [Paenarthrobacter nicotinovorans]|uniref:RCC1 domain-containing protein n=1 Tax=Paenarthrobacter nicotinovorans TaxID=29320 RepID=UPI003814200D
MAAFLYRHAGSPTFTAPAMSPFTDVPVGAAFYKEITWLASKGISTGWDIGGGKREYRPLSPIARDAMAAFLYRYANKPAFTAPSVSPFGDVPAGGSFYTEITWLAESGISTGWDIGGGAREYRPLNGIARDAMAAFLYRYAGQKTPADPTNPAAGTVTVAPDVEILEPTQLQTAQVTTNTVALPSDQATDIKPNDVLVSGVTPGTPDGLLARVVQVIRDPGGTTLLKTKPATLPEAVVSTAGLLEITGTPISSQFIPEPDVTVTTPSAVAHSMARNPELDSPLAAVEGEVFSQSFTLKATYKSEISHESGDVSSPVSTPRTNTLSGNGAVSVASTVRASAKAKMTLEAGFLKLKEASVVMTPSFSAEQQVSVSGGLEGKVSAKLGVLKAWMQFWAGPVPVVVTGDAEVAANLTVAGDAEISVASSQTVSADYGFKYREGSFNLINTKPKTAGVQNEVSASASLTARLSLDFDAEIKLYGVAGITFGAGPYFSAAIAVVANSGGLTWSCPIELGLESRLGVVVGVEVMGFKLEQSAVASTTWKLAEPNPCEGLPVTPPGPKPTPTPTPEPSATVPAGFGDVKKVSANGASTHALKSDGTVWAWKLEGNAETGVVTDSSVPERLPNLAGMKDIETGPNSSLGLKEDGTVWSWGANMGGELGNGTTSPALVPAQVQGLTGITSIAIGSESAYALKNDGTIWSWGSNRYGSLGRPTATNFSTTPAPLPDLSNVKSLTANIHSAYAIRNDGTLWTWGLNNHGQLGNGTTWDNSAPARVMGLSNVLSVQASYFSVSALTADGSVWTWGDNAYGQVGNGATTVVTNPYRVPGLPEVTAVQTRFYSNYAVGADGSVWAWGRNEYGVLGIGGTSNASFPIRVPGLSNTTEVKATYGSAYALLGDGSVRAWGRNGNGELGNGTTTDSSTPVTVQGLSDVAEIVTGVYQPYALKRDRTLWAWGFNQFGELGNGTTVDSSVPVRVGG